MLYSFLNGEISAVPFYGYTELKGKEKDLENLLARHLQELFVEDDLLMTIFQERQWQEEPDICALDRSGNLVIFELKRESVNENTAIQIMRYAQSFGQKGYVELNEMFQTYQKDKNTEIQSDLMEAHMQAFGLDHPLPPDRFNNRQKLILVGNSSDASLINAVNYWQKSGLDIDFIPYRFYQINGALYFEFFTKPFDFHLNPKDRKAIIFDTNKSYDEDSIWEMLAGRKVSAYGGANYFVDWFNKGDIVLYYHKGYGIVAAGQVISSQTQSIDQYEEKFRAVQLITPTHSVTLESELKYVSPSELSEITGKNFYYASTVKRPYLSTEEADKIIGVLKKKYEAKDIEM